MTEFIHKPYDKIYVRDMIKLSLDDFIDQEMTGTMDIRVRLEGSMKNPRTLNEIVNLQDMLENNKKVTTSFSIADVVKQMHRVVMDDDPDFETIPEDQGKVNNLFSIDRKSVV